MRRFLMASLVAALLIVSLFAQQSRAQNFNFPGTMNLFCGTATAASAAATLANKCGVITSEALTTAQDATYTLVITATGAVAAADLCMASLANGSNTQGTPVITRTTPTANTLTIVVYNKHASAQALNGTLVITYICFKASN